MTARLTLPPEYSAGPFSFRAARDAGLSASRLRGGDLKRPFYAVRSPHPSPLDLRGLCRAYQEYMPTHAFFCGVTAALIMNVPLPLRHEQSRTLHVAVPTPRRCPAGRDVAGHTIIAEDADTRVWEGLRISTPERTWFDLGAVLSVPDLVAVTDFLIQRGSRLTSRQDLARAVSRYSGRRGRRGLREALELASDRAESRKESHLRVIIARAQLDGLVVNLEIRTSGGYDYRADLAFPEQRVLLEYQSDYHGDMEQFRKDMTRRSRLEADGWFVMLINADDLKNPEELVARIRKVLSSRTLPTVR